MRMMKRKMERKARSLALTNSSAKETVIIEVLASTDKRRLEMRLRRRKRMRNSEMAHFVPQRMPPIMTLPRTSLEEAHCANRSLRFWQRGSIFIRGTGAD